MDVVIKQTPGHKERGPTGVDSDLLISKFIWNLSGHHTA